MREDALLKIKLINERGSAEGLHDELAGAIPARPEKIAESTDLPLSTEARRVLSRAADEAEELKHRSIDSGHLVLGVFAMKGKAADALHHQGVSYDAYREALASPEQQSQVRATASEAAAKIPAAEARGRDVAASSLREPISKLEQLLEQTSVYVRGKNENFGYFRLKRKPWTRKQAVGHLIDWAAAHHEWFARALAEPTLAAAGYPEDSWVQAQRYTEVSWTQLCELWLSLNRLIIHVLSGVPEEKLHMICRIGIEPPRTLADLIASYTEHCEDIVGQMLAHG